MMTLRVFTQDAVPRPDGPQTWDGCGNQCESDGGVEKGSRHDLIEIAQSLGSGW